MPDYTWRFTVGIRGIGSSTRQSFATLACFSGDGDERRRRTTRIAPVVPLLPEAHRLEESRQTSRREAVLVEHPFVFLRAVDHLDPVVPSIALRHREPPLEHRLEIRRADDQQSAALEDAGPLRQ